MVEDTDPSADAPAVALSPEVVDLLCLVATPPTRPVMSALRRKAPATVTTVARTSGLPADTVEVRLTALADRNLVRRAGTPPRYRFTDAGAALWPVLDALDDLRDTCDD